MGDGLVLSENAESGICGAFCLVAIAISVFHVRSHLVSFSNPTHQTHIVRILIMVPIYSVFSWLSLTFHNQDVVFDSIRDCYEAFTIYSFLQLLHAYIGSESTVCEHYREQGEMERSWLTGSCCAGPIKLDKEFLRWCKQGVIQFVIAKPVLAATVLVLDSQGWYEKDNWSFEFGFVWVQIVYNFCYSWALYALALFYGSTATLLKPYHPVKKFIMVKLIVFVSFWQGLTISLLVSFGTVQDPGVASRIQGVLICIEMAFAAGAHMLAFPANEYTSNTGQNIHTGTTALGNLSQAVNVKDVVSDTFQNFTTTYREYEMQSHKDDHDKSPQSVVGRTVQRSYIISDEGLEKLSRSRENSLEGVTHLTMEDPHALDRRQPAPGELPDGVEIQLEGAPRRQVLPATPPLQGTPGSMDDEADDAKLL